MPRRIEVTATGDPSRIDDMSWPSISPREAAPVALARWEPTYVLGPRPQGYTLGEDVYIDAEDETARVVSVHLDGTAEAKRLHDLDEEVAA